jgi:hypothetical protein
MLGLALALAVLGWPLATGAGERLVVTTSRQGLTTDHSDGGPPPLSPYLAALEGGAAPGWLAMASPEQHWSSFLPLLAEEARRLGYELPPAFRRERGL